MNIYRNELLPMLSRSDWVAIDTELFGMEDNKLHRPNTGEFALVQIAVGNDVYVFDNPDTLQLSMGRIKDAVWIFHNAKFDLIHLRRWVKDDVDRKEGGKIWDTMLMDRILYGGYFERFSLAHLARRHLDVLIDKDIRKDFEDAEELTDEMIEYGAKDAYYTLKICEEQKKTVDKDDFKIWSEVDLPALWAIMNFKGFRLGIEAWEKLAKEHEELAQEYKDTFDLNPASLQQVKERLNGLGARINSTRAEILEDLIEDDPESEVADICQRVLDYRSKAKLASTYGMNWIEKYVEDDLIYSDYKVVGASTGRTASRRPNIQNVPVRDTTAYRECFIPRDGNKLIVADYSAQEPRILAYLSQDKEMIDIFNDDKDVYIETVKLMYGKEITKDDPFRDEAKAIILGAGYGLSPYGYAKKYNVSKKEAEEKLNTYFKTFPDVQNWVYQQERKRGYVTSVLGRKFHLNPYSYQKERHTRNAPIQSTAADQLKMALGRLYKNWPKDLCEYGLVGQVHDEIIADVPEECAEEIAQYIQETMEEVAEDMCPGIKFSANSIICDTWAGAK